MPQEPTGPEFLWELFSDLRRRKFPLGISDYDDLRMALRLGFGWESDEALVELCCTLWAKSRRDADIIRALFAQFEAPEWTLESRREETPPVPSPATSPEVSPMAPAEEPAARPEAVAVEKAGGLPPISLAGVEMPVSHFTLVPNFPVTYREVAQAWRRVRQPARFGPRTEIDLDATLAQATRTGVLAGPVLVPPRRNTSRLLLLIDSMGSMAPFRPFVREVAGAITSAGDFGRVGVFYFHDTPAEGSIEPPRFVPEGLYPTLDPFLNEIVPLATGYLYEDEALTTPVEISEVYQTYATNAVVVILSDGGAARGSYDYQRLLDTIASLKYLRLFTRRIVWLNPLPDAARNSNAGQGRGAAWAHSTAAQIARHVPMFAIDAGNLHRAVAGLKSEHFELEKGL